jgi:O-antigen/teichoic acid export membrane protein
LFILVKRTEDYYIYYGIIVAAAIINLLTNVFNLFKDLRLTTHNLNWKRHLKYTWVTYLISLFSDIMIWLDNVLLGLVSTVVAVGIYALSAKIIRIGTNLLTDMFLVLYPRTASLLHEGKETEAGETIDKTAQLIILLTIPAGTGMFLLSKPLVQTLLAGSFIGAAGNLKILALLPFVKTYRVFLSNQILMAYYREKLYLQALIAGSVLYVFLTLGFSWYWQDAGACYALVAGEAFILGSCYYYVKKKMPGLKLFHAATFFQSLVTAALFIPVIKLINTHVSSPALILVASIFICIPLYFLVQLLIMKNRLVTDLYRMAKTFVRAGLTKTS